MWILSILILVLMVSSFWFRKGREIPPWVKCKESLFAQVVLKQCTPSSFANPQDFNDEDQDKLIEEELPYEPPQN